MAHESILFGQLDNESESEISETNLHSNNALSVQDKIKSIEETIMRKVELSSLAAESREFGRALDFAKEALEALNSLRAIFLHEQRSINAPASARATTDEDDDGLGQNRSDEQRMTTEIDLFDLLVMVKSNLAAQFKNTGQLDDSLEMYTQICKLAVSHQVGGTAGSSTHASMSNGQQQQYSSKYLLYRFGLNIGNVLFEMGEYQRALKYYRLTLDRLSSSGNRSLRIKLMNNISIVLVAMNGPDSVTGLGSRKQVSLTSADHIISLNRLLSDNLDEIQQQPSRQQQQQARLSSTATSSVSKGGGAGAGSGGTIFQACNSNHHIFGLNLMACYHGASDMRLMRSTLASLVKVGICHHYERVFDFDKLLNDDRTADESCHEPEFAHRKESDHARTGQEPTGDGHLRLVVNQRDTTSQVSSQQSTVFVGGGTNTPSLIAHDSDSAKLSQHAQSAADKSRQVMEKIRADKLEMLIGEKEKDVSRSIIVSCNLLIDLDRQKRRASQKHTTPQQDRNHVDDEHEFRMKKVRRIYSMSALGNSAFDQCIHLLATSDLYKSLVYDLRMDNVSRLLRRKKKLCTALSLLERMHSDQHVGAVGGGYTNNRPPDSGPVKSARIESTLSPLVATDMSLLYLLKNQVQRALKMNQRALQMSKFNVESIINMANCHFITNDMTKAEVCYVKALKIDPNNWIAHHNLAVLNSKLGRHFDDLNPTTKKFIVSSMQKLTPPVSRKLSLSQYLLALLYQQSGLDIKSSALFNLLVSGITSSPEVYVHASKSLSETSNTGQRALSALSFLQQGRQIHSYYLPLAERLIALHISQFNYDEAELALLDCIKNRPDQARWYEMLAECCRRAADYKKAIRIYKYAIDKFPMNTSCLKALAKLADELGLSEEKEACQTKLQLILDRQQAQIMDED